MSATDVERLAHLRLNKAINDGRGNHEVTALDILRSLAYQIAAGELVVDKLLLFAITHAEPMLHGDFLAFHPILTVFIFHYFEKILIAT